MGLGFPISLTLIGVSYRPATVWLGCAKTQMELHQFSGAEDRAGDRKSPVIRNYGHVHKILGLDLDIYLVVS